MNRKHKKGLPESKKEREQEGTNPKRIKTVKHTTNHRDPVGIIKETNQGRLLDLVPIRHSRMLVSPFTYYRGAAAVMAADLALQENSGIYVQSCGDCHILNCGAFATPERNIIIDLNDFDETHPAPFEWDLKRLAASMVLAIRSANMSTKLGQAAAYEIVRSYQREMANYAKSRLLDVWYSTINYQSFMEKSADRARQKQLKDMLAKERKKSSPDVLEQKLITRKNGKFQFKELPPLLYHRNDIDDNNVQRAYQLYLKSLPADRAGLLKHYTLVDFATKVVGTGSVGTYCAVALLVGQNDDLIILQVKEARPSVLEPFTKASPFENHGQRVVVGQRIMQSASDMFLGWAVSDSGRHFYVRQLRDVKMSPNPQLWTKKRIPQISDFAGKILAKAHAKSGEATAITEFIGKSDKFAKQIAQYAVEYANLTEEDYLLFANECQSGKLPTVASTV